MAAPSFSLPAGPRGQSGGSCPASALSPVPGRPFLCHLCYALHGNYLRPEQYAIRVVRQRWVMRRLATPGALAAELIAALEECHDRPPGHTGFWNLRYFRVHDSGDFMGDARYVREWNAVARHFSTPRLKEDGTRREPMIFWSPTREWVYFPEVVRAGLAAGKGNIPPTSQLGASVVADLARAMRSVAEGGECPPNHIIRPSALHIGDEPPIIRGLAAGSTVLKPSDFGADGDGIERCGYAPGGPHCHCPAYERGERWTHHANCADARCRACWLLPDRSIDYAEK